MSIPENNGTPPIVREWNDSRASRRATPPTYTPSATSYFRHWSIVAAVGVLVILFLVLFGVVPGVGAAERRPAAEQVEIVKVTGDAGWYVVKLADGRVLSLTPPRSRARVTPAPQLGEARLTSTTLIRNGYSYARVRK